MKLLNVGAIFCFLLAAVIAWTGDTEKNFLRVAIATHIPIMIGMAFLLLSYHGGKRREKDNHRASS